MTVFEDAHHRSWLNFGHTPNSLITSIGSSIAFSLVPILLDISSETLVAMICRIRVARQIMGEDPSCYMSVVIDV